MPRTESVLAVDPASERNALLIVVFELNEARELTVSESDALNPSVMISTFAFKELAVSTVFEDDVKLDPVKLAFVRTNKSPAFIVVLAADMVTNFDVFAIATLLENTTLLALIVNALVLAPTRMEVLLLKMVFDVIDKSAVVLTVPPLSSVLATMEFAEKIPCR